MKRVVAAIGEVVPSCLLLAIFWEAMARLGPFPPKLFPPVATVVSTFLRLLSEGILLRHFAGTLGRLALSFLLAGVAGVALGMAMGRSRRAEDFFLPLLSIGSPIPGIAYAPLFILWFGLGDLPTVLIVGFAAMFPVAFNTWTGVKTVKPVWVRAAQAMGAGEGQLFRKVVLPGCLPYVLTGLRLGLARAWRVLVAAEMLTAVRFGLGWMIFGAREFLNTDVMLAGIAAIGIMGLVLEKQVFARLEAFTIVRWGMATR